MLVKSCVSVSSITRFSHSSHAHSFSSPLYLQFVPNFLELFTIGLFQLNPGGTVVLKDDGSGEIAETYTNEDIMDLSRAWTNFHRRAERPNLEVYSDFYAG